MAAKREKTMIKDTNKKLREIEERIQEGDMNGVYRILEDEKMERKKRELKYICSKLKRTLKRTLAAGNIRDLAGKICKALCGKDYSRIKDDLLNEVVRNYVKEKYHLELSDERLREHEEKCAKKLGIDLAGKHMKPLFLKKREVDRERLETDEDYEDKCNEEKRLQISYEKIFSKSFSFSNFIHFANFCNFGNSFSFNEFSGFMDFSNFSNYYEDIAANIEKMPQFFKEDLNYILLQNLASMTENVCKIGDEEFIELEEKDFLKVPESTADNPEKYLQKLLKNIEGILKEPIRCPVAFEGRIDEDGKCLCIAKANVKIQLALLFYPEFRKRFLKTSKKGKHDLESIIEIIENIDSIIGGGEIKEGGTDSILFPYLIEYAMGINLSLTYVKYYQVFKEREGFGKNEKEILFKIFDNFCEMPNVFSRIQILRDFLDSALMFNRDMEKQLTIIQNVTKELAFYFKEMGKEISLLIKSAVTDEKVRKDYISSLEGKCCGMEYMKKVFASNGKKGYIFVEECNEEDLNSVIFKEAQKIYEKKYKK